MGGRNGPARNYYYLAAMLCALQFRPSAGTLVLSIAPLQYTWWVSVHPCIVNLVVIQCDLRPQIG